MCPRVIVKLAVGKELAKQILIGTPDVGAVDTRTASVPLATSKFSAFAKLVGGTSIDTVALCAAASVASPASSGRQSRAVSRPRRRWRAAGRIPAVVRAGEEPKLSEGAAGRRDAERRPAEADGSDGEDGGLRRRADAGGSARLGSARLGSARLGSAGIITARCRCQADFLWCVHHLL